MKSKNIIIGSRGSKLALIYAETAKRIISKNYKDFNISDFFHIGEKKVI